VAVRLQALVDRGFQGHQALHARVVLRIGRRDATPAVGEAAGERLALAELARPDLPARLDRFRGTRGRAVAIGLGQARGIERGRAGGEIGVRQGRVPLLLHGEDRAPDVLGAG
jgi:hypothetical protein